VIAPNPIGNWATGPLPAFTSSGFSAGSLPAKSTVADWSWAIPAPEPTALKLTVSPCPFSVEPHCM
jgi:hypothetical protein